MLALVRGKQVRTFSTYCYFSLESVPSGSNLRVRFVRQTTAEFEIYLYTYIYFWMMKNLNAVCTVSSMHDLTIQALCYFWLHARNISKSSHQSYLFCVGVRLWIRKGLHFLSVCPLHSCPNSLDKLPFMAKGKMGYRSQLHGPTMHWDFINTNSKDLWTVEVRFISCQPSFLSFVMLFVRFYWKLVL